MISEDFIDETREEDSSEGVLSDVATFEDEAQDEKDEKIIARKASNAAMKWTIFSIVGKIAKLLS